MGATLVTPAANAGTLTTIYRFTGGADGSTPLSGVIYKNGTLYGTTTNHGSRHHGTVFKLNPATGELTTLYSFKGGKDAADPGGVIYVAGKLYGVSAFGGEPNCTYGCGTLFEVNATTGAEKVLYRFPPFNNGSASQEPGGVNYQAGLLFGVTGAGGNMCGGGQGCGTVFTFNPKTNVEAVLYAFTGGADGFNPGSLIYHEGYFYGTTGLGAGTGCGGQGCGTLYKLDPATGALTVLYTFTGGADGGWPEYLSYQGGVFYGALADSQLGAVFAFNPVTGAESVLHTFTGTKDGWFPDSPPKLYLGALDGWTWQGGIDATDCPQNTEYAGCGVIYRLHPNTGEISVLHSFNGTDGAHPAGPFRNIDGVRYGTTEFGGTGPCKFNCGTVFKFTP